MRLQTTALAATLAVVATMAGALPALAIKGGKQSPQPYSFMGSLQRPDSPRADGHVCGVTLIAPQWAITASHCVRNPNLAQVGTPRDWKVRFGALSTKTGGELTEVDKFYRYSNFVHEGDFALLHLKTPVRAEPAKMPSATPADHTPARIIGWGMTCDDRKPECYPEFLREADTKVQPDELCKPAGIHEEREICVGAEDGSVAPTNMDSGGPALIREGDRWVVVGAVSGGNSTQPIVYTDVHWYTAWINGITSGTAVPPDSPRPNLEGAVDLGMCAASVVRTPESRPQDPALLLTNGHCVRPEPPKPGSALVDLPADEVVRIGDRDGYAEATAKANRLLYATMTGTDIALYRLDRTYAELAADGAKIFQLAASPARAGEKIDVLSGGQGNRFSCVVEAEVPHLREDGYQQDGALRYAAGCGASHGSSGSPLVAADGVSVVGVHNTGNDDGEQCTRNNPCEVAADGTVTVKKGHRYGQRVSMIPACVGAGSVLDLGRPGCTLNRPAA
ncbi:trypsin-like serine protease [Crossiella cryophila]|uniref:Peptidase S1 domain-containing protein n=1 Tax=Crossiella cryophila TaxID=43355 RepID=A0A7W7FV19_9PSEU|nr:trypsin-like serine protease [Crossiella cryophila]MBB4678817.1 hypothetical protein [Crossiella cryophila]